MRIRNVVRLAWYSPTFTSYGAFLARALGQVILLPFILTIFSTEEVYLWYLFATITSLQLLVDMGFSQTFSRVISFAMGGSGLSDLLKPKGNADGKPSISTINKISQTMVFVYMRLSIAWFLIVLVLGTLVVWQPISAIQNNGLIWIAWGVVVLVSPISLFGAVYSSFLLGINKIATLRRWEIITSLLSMLTCLATVVFSRDFVLTLLVFQFWLVVVVFRNRQIAKHTSIGSLKTLKPSMHLKVMASIWPSAWRTGVGTSTGYGVIQISALVVAHVATLAEATSYFLAIKLIQLVSQFSQAPFYSKLPILARMYAEGRQTEMVKLAKRGMILSYLTFLAGFIFLGLFGEASLTAIGSNVDFPDFPLWALLGIGFYVERYGAMHINLFSSCNLIINHIANGITGVLYIISGIALYPILGVYTFPASILIGNIAFYSWFAAIHSYRAFALNYWSFEKTTMLPGLAMLIAYILVTLSLTG